MNPFKKWISLSLLLLLVLIPFTNCSQYPQANEFNDSLSLGSQGCESGNCESPEDFLKVEINMDDPFAFARENISLAIGGLCNDAGFAQHVIDWRIAPEDNSGATSSGTLPCSQGRFAGVVALPILGAPETLVLTLIITGFDEEGRSYSNPFSGQDSIRLTPL